jgi:hypothetical protein
VTHRTGMCGRRLGGVRAGDACAINDAHARGRKRTRSAAAMTVFWRARSVACLAPSRRPEAMRWRQTRYMKRSRKRSPRSSSTAPRQEISLLRASRREYFSPTAQHICRLARAYCISDMRATIKRTGGAIAGGAPPCYNRSPESEARKGLHMRAFIAHTGLLRVCSTSGESDALVRPSPPYTLYAIAHNDAGCTRMR